MEKMLIVGEVLKPQGIRGEIKVKPFTDSPEDFYAFKRVFLGGEEYRVLKARMGGGAVFLTLRGVPDRNAAELLRGKEISVLREDAPALEEGVYYIADLLGSAVETEAGEHLGVLTDIRPAATDIYTLEKDGKEILFPAVEGVILGIEPGAKRIVVDPKRFGEVAVKN